MHPVRMLSFANDWEILSKQKKEEWSDIQNALAELTVERLRKSSLVLEDFR
jgi:hypothetical protein